MIIINIKKININKFNIDNLNANVDLLLYLIYN